MPLEQPDQQHLIAAQGYAELGMFLDSNDELEKIDPEVRHLPEVLKVRVQIYSGLKKWDLMGAVAEKLTLYDPGKAQSWVNWAYATRRCDSIEAAHGILSKALEHHPDEAVVWYNLACYECQLGDLKGAKEKLGTAIELNAKIRAMALEDEDLRPLWDSLATPL